MDLKTSPLESASALDASCYTSEALYRFELDTVLGRGWQLLAGSAQVARAGDVLVREIAGVPVLLVRPDAGRLNGFFNVCPHRAGPLATSDMRAQKRLRCAYHGWIYDFEGRLVSAREMDTAVDFNVGDISLKPIDVVEWKGFVFARLREGPDFEAVYAGIESVVGEAGFAGMAHHSSLVYDVGANWKVYVDNYLEGYHLPLVHPGLTQLVDYAEYTTELGRWWSLQRSPVAESGPYGAGEGHYFFVYPNTMLNFMPGRIQTNRVVPTGLDTCRVEFDFYYAPGADARAAEDLAFSDRIQEEDRTICERVQRGLASGAYDAGRLSPSRESGVWHWQNLLRSEYGRF